MRSPKKNSLHLSSCLSREEMMVPERSRQVSLAWVSPRLASFSSWESFLESPFAAARLADLANKLHSSFPSRRIDLVVSRRSSRWFGSPLMRACCARSASSIVSAETQSRRLRLEIPRCLFAADVIDCLKSSQLA